MIASILARLVAFPTISQDSNLPLLDWVEDHLAPFHPRARRFPSPDGAKASLLISFGPDEPGGLVLSGHTDVVPVEGQLWQADPFTLREAGSRLIGRGACDMKGFLACCLALAPDLQSLRHPVHFAFSYDEEVGCTGVGPMAEWIGETLNPALAVIGEPSNLRLVNAHKGGLVGSARITGSPGHASQPDRCVNAVMIAAECITRISRMRAAMRSGPVNDAFDPPWSTVQVNRIEGGEGLNIVAGTCTFFWEMRILPGLDDHRILSELQQEIATEVLPAMRAIDPACDIRFEIIAQIPALAPCDPAIEAKLLNVLGQNGALAVPYGTEAGIFQRAGVPSVILGPGNIAQAHKPEEWVERAQLDECVDILRKLVRSYC